MLVRLALLVDEVVLECPGGVPIHSRVIPFLPDHSDLATGLVSAGVAIGIVPIRRGEIEDANLQLHLGPGAQPESGLRVHGEGWSGGFTRGGCDARVPGSSLPFGPYIAACLAVGEVFRATRVNQEEHPVVDAAFYSAWTNQTSASLNPVGPKEFDAISLDACLGGVGAVGAAWMHAIWGTRALSGEVLCADADERGIDESNLNRGVLFRTADVGRQKAQTAAAAVDSSNISWIPVSDRLENIGERPPFTVVAVDTNKARSAIQALYPFPLLFASTYDLRAEIIRCDPTRGGPCMRCFNEPETERPDSELIDAYRNASQEERKTLAQGAGVSLADAEEWLEDPVGRCATAGARVLDVLRQTGNDDPRLFAVPFVSVFAGTMLAAESVKEVAFGNLSLSPDEPRTVFTFLRPMAPTNGAGPYPRDPLCPQCDPASRAAEIWARRASAVQGY